jgi:hypothetical protein
MLRVMVLTPAPDLVYVVGVPFGLLLLVLLLGTGIYVAMGRARRG